jgi:hypothetical protein
MIMSKQSDARQSADNTMLVTTAERATPLLPRSLS